MVWVEKNVIEFKRPSREPRFARFFFYFLLFVGTGFLLVGLLHLNVASNFIDSSQKALLMVTKVDVSEKRRMRATGKGSYKVRKYRIHHVAQLSGNAEVSGHSGYWNRDFGQQVGQKVNGFYRASDRKTLSASHVERWQMNSRQAPFIGGLLLILSIGYRLWAIPRNESR